MSRWRRRGVVCAALLWVPLLVVSCADRDERSFCDVYSSYLVVVTPTLEADPTSVTAAEAADAVDEALGAAQRVRQVSDSRYAAATDDLIDLLDDLRRTLDSFEDGESYATWQPLVEDTIDDATIAHQRLVELVGTSCDRPS